VAIQQHTLPFFANLSAQKPYWGQCDSMWRMQASAASMGAWAIAREADAHLACMGAGVIGSFHPFSPLAAALVAPTQLWVTVAAKLNYDIVKLNTGKDGRT